jgi:hypothetical protein
MENQIKEQQTGLFADRLSTESIRGNQFRLYCSSIAYMLMHALRRLALKVFPLFQQFSSLMLGRSRSNLADPDSLARMWQRRCLHVI